MTEHPILFSGPMVRAILEGRKTVTRRIVKPMAGLQSKWLTMSGINNVPHGAMSGGGWQMHHPLADQCVDGVQIEHDSPLGWIRCPYGSAGDSLWLKESYRFGSDLDSLSPNACAIKCAESGYRKPWAPTRYEADGATDNADTLRDFGAWGKLRPSIHMPRWASRLLLDVVSVRVERLQDITEEDAKAEGCKPYETGEAWLCVPKSGGTYEMFVEPDDEEKATLDFWRREPSMQLGTALKTFEGLWNQINGKRANWESNPWVWVVSFRRVQP